MREQRLIESGVPANEARRQARREFGNPASIRETAVEFWPFLVLHQLLQDLGYGIRTLRRTPAFTAAAIVTIAIGVGVNAGIFTVLNGVLFRDLPAPDAHELTSIFQTIDGVEGHAMAGGGTFSTSEYRAYRDRAQTLSGVLAIGQVRGETTLGGDAPQLIYGALVSCNYFAVLEQPPVLGRAFAPTDCEPGADPVVVLGHELWTTAFAADPGIVGRTVALSRQTFTVGGVAAEDTDGGFVRIGYFAPISTDPLFGQGDPRYDDDTQHWLHLIGRRNEATGLAQVRAELGVIAAQIDQQEPGRSTTLTVERAVPGTVPLDMRGAAAGAAAVLMAAVGFILVIACANVANLLLARGRARGHEIGIRLSLGANRARVVRQLLTESLLISLAGGLVGTVLALWSFQALVALALPAMIPPDLPIALAWDLSPDVRVLSFAAVLICGTGVLFGFAPALHMSKPDLYGVMKQGSRGVGGTGRGGRLRGTLVGVQVALCMTLMIASGLLLRGLYATYTVDPGFDYGNVATVSLQLEQAGYAPEDAAALWQRLRNEIEALPGVAAVASTMRAPLGTDMARIPIHLPGENQSESRIAEINAVEAGYFSLLGIPMVRGRTFTESELARAGREAGTRPAIVSEMTARNLWGEGDPIGRTFVAGDDSLEVVGVAADAQTAAIGQIDSHYIYVPGSGMLLVRSRTGVSTTASGIRTAVRALDPGLFVRVLPVEANLGWWRGVSGTVTALGAGLGALALVLASVGIYGVVSYAVTRRYREIGVRMALGASPRDVLMMLLRQTMRPVVVGAVIGVAAASAMSGILSSVLFGVSPADPAGFGGAVLLVLGVALIAGIMAARRATWIDPMTTLHSE
jgi:predicted permease